MKKEELCKLNLQNENELDFFLEEIESNIKNISFLSKMKFKLSFIFQEIKRFFYSFFKFPFKTIYVVFNFKKMEKIFIKISNENIINEKIKNLLKNIDNFPILKKLYKESPEKYKKTYYLEFIYNWEYSKNLFRLFNKIYKKGLNIKKGELYGK